MLSTIVISESLMKKKTVKKVCIGKEKLDPDQDGNWGQFCYIQVTTQRHKECRLNLTKYLQRHFHFLELPQIVEFQLRIYIQPLATANKRLTTKK